jgi:RNA polymerase sigma-70 factor (ECF subfamily)
LFFSALRQASALKPRIAELRPRLYRLAYAWCHDAYLADDLAQEALIKGLKSVHQLKDEAVLEAWLFSILNNCWRDHFRRLHPQADLDEIMELPADGPTPEQHHADHELAGRVQRAVATLPLGQRQVVTLVDLEEMSYGAAAQALGIPVGTVMSRLSRARLALRQLLQESPVALHVLPTKTRRGQ